MFSISAFTDFHTQRASIYPRRATDSEDTIPSAKEIGDFWVNTTGKASVSQRYQDSIDLEASMRIDGNYSGLKTGRALLSAKQHAALFEMSSSQQDLRNITASKLDTIWQKSGLADATGLIEPPRLQVNDISEATTGAQIESSVPSNQPIDLINWAEEQIKGQGDQGQITTGLERLLSAFQEYQERSSEGRSLSSMGDVVVRHFDKSEMPDLSSIGSDYGFVPGHVLLSDSPDEMLGNNRGKFESLLKQVALERQMRRQYGSDVKIAFDNRSSTHILLRPGDRNYADTKNGDEVVRDVLTDFKKGFGDLSDFRDIFEKYRVSTRL